MAESNNEIKLSDEQIRKSKNAFDQFDKKKQGLISTNDLDNALRACNVNVDADLLKEWADLIDEEATGMIDKESFILIVQRKMQEDADERELKEAFRCLDKHKTGEIDVSQLRWILKSLHEDITEEELDSIIRDIDTDSSGTVDFDEFYRLMKSD